MEKRNANTLLPLTGTGCSRSSADQKLAHREGNQSAESVFDRRILAFAPKETRDHYTGCFDEKIVYQEPTLISFPAGSTGLA